MLRRNFLSLIPPGLLSVIGINSLNAKLPVQEQEEIIDYNYIKIYKIGNRVIYETTETKVDIRGREDITELIARNAIHVYCGDCISLTKVDLPVATTVYCGDCISLTKLDLPVATTVYCERCTSLTNLDLPVATYVDCWGCTSLHKLYAPVATTVYCRDCTSLAELYAPVATNINCYGCTSLPKLKLS